MEAAGLRLTPPKRQIADDLVAQADERGSERSYAGALLNRTLEGKITVVWNLKTHRQQSVEGERKGTSDAVRRKSQATAP